MRWIVRIELIDDDGSTASVDAFSVERPKLITEAQLGLTHGEGKSLRIASIQAILGLPHFV